MDEELRIVSPFDHNDANYRGRHVRARSRTFREPDAFSPLIHGWTPRSASSGIYGLGGGVAGLLSGLGFIIFVRYRLSDNRRRSSGILQPAVVYSGDVRDDDSAHWLRRLR